MTTENLIKTFNPTNAANLTAEDLLYVSTLTIDEIDILAKSYPNKAHGNGYLILKDKTYDDNRQLYHLSTWQNFRNVKKYSNSNNLYVYSFSEIFKPIRINMKAPLDTVQKKVDTKRVSIDLSHAEAEKELSSIKESVKDEPGIEQVVKKSVDQKGTGLKKLVAHHKKNK